jgi:hypothetical protein
MKYDTVLRQRMVEIANLDGVVSTLTLPTNIWLSNTSFPMNCKDLKFKRSSISSEKSSAVADFAHSFTVASSCLEIYGPQLVKSKSRKLGFYQGG